MSCDVGEATEAWRMKTCDVREAKEGLDNEL